MKSLTEFINESLESEIQVKPKDVSVIRKPPSGILAQCM